jgi:hypothetical protein
MNFFIRMRWRSVATAITVAAALVGGAFTFARPPAAHVTQAAVPRPAAQDGVQRA